MSSGEATNEVWQPENLNFYLNVYYSDVPDWNRQLERLRAKGKSKDVNRRHLGFTILAPYMLRMRPTDPPEALLFACFKFDNFYDLDWADLLEKTYDQDQIIKQRRKALLQMGSIVPVEYHSRSRQAIKWIYEQASEDPSVTSDNKAEVLNRLKSVVVIYGPSAICSLFQRPEIRSVFLTKTPNWRTGYFIEHSLYEHFSFEQLQQIKERDLESAPEELVKFFGEPSTEQSS